MKLIVDIPKEEYNSIKEIKYYISERRSGKRLMAICLNSIANGTPLEDIVDGIESHKWGNNEGSKEIYNNAINDVLTYIEETLGE